jgi:hypothetical protein
MMADEEGVHTMACLRLKMVNAMSGDVCVWQTLQTAACVSGVVGGVRTKWAQYSANHESSDHFSYAFCTRLLPCMACSNYAH